MKSFVYNIISIIHSSINYFFFLKIRINYINNIDYRVKDGRRKLGIEEAIGQRRGEGQKPGSKICYILIKII